MNVLKFETDRQPALTDTPFDQAHAQKVRDSAELILREHSSGVAHIVANDGIGGRVDQDDDIEDFRSEVDDADVNDLRWSGKVASTD